MKPLFLMLALLALAGCSKEPPPAPQIVTVVPQCNPPPLPGECVSEDPSWTVLPDSAIDAETPPRVDGTNYEAFTAVTGKRRVCRKAILAGRK